MIRLPHGQGVADGIESDVTNGSMETQMQNADAVGLTYRSLSSSEREMMYTVKEKGKEFLDLIDQIGFSEELATAKRRVEEAVMWAVKHISA